MADTEVHTETKPVTVETGAHHDSEEYESAEEIYEEEEVEEIEIEEEVEEEEDCETPVAEERKLDDDEDRQNPQFIPKKGYFYEHDDRTQADEEEEEDLKEEAAKEEKPKKTKDPERWSHDLYDESEQAHKTTEEIVAIYGYDIRADEQPPKAVRRRRYGRGPKKYTRKSDDMEAYQKPRGGYGGRGRRQGFNTNRGGGGGGSYDADFPALKPGDKKDDKENSSSDSKLENPSSVRGARGGGRPPRVNRGFDEREKEFAYSDRDRGHHSEYPNRGRGRGGRGRRNEFTNRNRYPDRRESNGKASDYHNETVPGRREQGDTRKDRPWMEHDDTRDKPSNGHQPPERQRSERQRAERSDAATSKSSKNIPPFSNTEYRGSGSLTNSGSEVAEPQEAANATSEDVIAVNGQEPKRDSIRMNSRDSKHRPTAKPFASERRSQVPPRLQQPQSPEQVNLGSVKSKRFSTQRQRQVNETAIQQTPIPSQIIPQVVPVQAPVVTGAATIVPSSVPNFTPQQNYYEAPASTFEPQVYEATGSPLTTNGPSVSPSLWGPHAAAYAAAPYPSPPTGTQVPVAQPGYGDPAAAAYIAAAPPPGPAIYAAPAQFIQDPSMLNFAAAPAPQFAPPYHPQGYQGYPQVTPAPPPEVYHGGVTYYNTHNQIQRPALITVQKRPKTVLQLVEPPEMKSTKDIVTASRRGDNESTSHVEALDGSAEHGVSAESRLETNVEEELSSRLQSLDTSDKRLETIDPPNQGKAESWASQMDQLSPTGNINLDGTTETGSYETPQSCADSENTVILVNGGAEMESNLTPISSVSKEVADAESVCETNDSKDLPENLKDKPTEDRKSSELTNNDVST